MTFFDAVKICFVKYTNFSDRATRSEFWLFMLFYHLVYLMLLPFDFLVTGEEWLFTMASWMALEGPFTIAFSIATLIPSISVSVRRLHDVNRTGWWLLILLAVIGFFLLLYWWCVESDKEANRFGPNPLNPSGTIE